MRRAARASFTANGGRAEWANWQVAACDASEFAPDAPLSGGTRVWFDEFDDDRIPTTRLLERDDCSGARILRLEGQLFVRDPEGAFDPPTLLDNYDGDAPAIEGLVPTGYRDGDRVLFQTREGRSIYVIDGTTLERWPRVDGDEIIRIDCN